MREIQITMQNENQRIDKFLLKILPGMSKSFCYKMFRKKNITLNNKKIEGSELCKHGDRIKVFFSDETYDKFLVTDSKVRMKDVPLPEILYEDDQLIVVNKSAGVLSQDDGSALSIVDQIKYYYVRSSIHLDIGVAVGISNRLDRNTSGITFSGKTLPMIQMLNNKIKNHEVVKIYRTIVVGKVSQPMELKDFLTKDSRINKVTVSTSGTTMIHTHISPLRWNDEYSELEVTIHTGKTHQIRAHLASIGHPVIGDAKYGDKVTNQYFTKNYRLTHQLLHAYYYQFQDKGIPLENPDYYIPFIAPLPDIYKEIAKAVFK